MKIITGIDFAVISHLHTDHFDQTAQSLLPQDLPLLCQAEDYIQIMDKGFRNVLPIKDTVTLGGVEIIRTPCQHGSGQVLHDMGTASGFILKHEREPVVYWAGDTIWCKEVEEVLCRFKPEIIVTHSCGAVWGNNVKIVMDAEQTVAVCLAAPASTVIATHMDAYDHATLSRADLKEYAQAHNISPKQLLIPRDGETYSF